MENYIAKGKSINVDTNEVEQVEIEVSLPNPRILEIEERLQDIRARFSEIDIQRFHHYDGVITDSEWEVFKSEKVNLYVEYHDLKNELATIV